MKRIARFVVMNFKSRMSRLVWCAAIFRKEIEHALMGRHTYSQMRVCDFILTLRDFCQVDFGSLRPEFFGLSKNERIGYEKMQFVRDVKDTSIRKDKVCVRCGYRLSFLKFIAEIRNR
jgi:hypothetical protein